MCEPEAIWRAQVPGAEYHRVRIVAPIDMGGIYWVPAFAEGEVVTARYVEHEDCEEDCGVALCAGGWRLERPYYHSPRSQGCVVSAAPIEAAWPLCLDAPPSARARAEAPR